MEMETKNLLSKEQVESGQQPDQLEPVIEQAPELQKPPTPEKTGTETEVVDETVVDKEPIQILPDAHGNAQPQTLTAESASQEAIKEELNELIAQDLKDDPKEISDIVNKAAGQ